MSTNSIEHQTKNISRMRKGAGSTKSAFRQTVEENRIQKKYLNLPLE